MRRHAQKLFSAQRIAVTSPELIDSHEIGFLQVVIWGIDLCQNDNSPLLNFENGDVKY